MMKLKISKNAKLAMITGSVCILLTAFVLMDAFLLPKTFEIVENSSQKLNKPVNPAVIMEYSYNDENIAILISTVTEDDVVYHIVDIRLSDVQYLQSAFAKDIYGKNVVETTSQIAKNNQAILAFNGDFYGSRDDGLIIRNGVLYRDQPRQAPDNRSLLINDQGDFIFITEGAIDGNSYLDKGVVHSLFFGPVLVEDGKVSKIDTSISKTENPRTAIGMIEPLHYLLIVVDGRSEQSKGMRLDTLAKLFVKLGAVSAFNLAGGGSSTLWFNGKIINQPSVIDLFSDERAISDILFIGY
jgi:exopolysaccharide biosynthesis protein